MRHYPSLGVGHMHVHTSTTDCSQAIPQNSDSNGGEVNSMESEEAEVDIAAAPITNITGGESDHLESTDDEDRGDDDLDSESGDEQWEDVDDVEEMYALHEMYDR